MVSEIERIQFDFSGDNVLDSINILDEIMCSSHWSEVTLNYKDERTKLLLRLLQIGGIAVYKRHYTQKAENPETMRCAKEINMFMGKRYITQALLDIAGIFSEYQYDGSKTIFNSLFFPELKAYVRCNGLPPDRLIEFMEQDGCDNVLLFPDTQSDEGCYFYAFVLAMPKELFMEAIEQMRERISEAISEALRKVEDRISLIIPPVNECPETE